MSYRFETGEAIPEAARRCAREQADKALEELRRDDKPVSWQIHQMRKRCKKIRAVARLVRPEFDHYKQANRRFRDIAKSASDERDARVMYELTGEIAPGERAGIDDWASAPLVRWHRLRNQLANEVLELRMPTLERQIADGTVAIERWDLSDVDAASMLKGLRKTLKRAHKALAALQVDRSPERFHELRKRCKYHWYHLRLLKALMPPDLEARIDVFDELCDLLGDAHDGSMFLAHGAELPGFIKNRPSSQWAIAAVTDRRRQLRKKALELGETALDVPADDLSRRLDEYWHTNREASTPLRAIPG